MIEERLKKAEEIIIKMLNSICAESDGKYEWFDPEFLEDNICTSMTPDNDVVIEAAKFIQS